MKSATWLQLVIFVMICGPAGLAQAEDVNAGPIWNQADANNKCPNVCSTHNHDHWNGQWKTTVQGKMSVCGCEPVQPPPPPPPPGSNKVGKEAGPIWNQADANNKCPRVCTAPTKWDGQWWTTVPNKMSVCECVSSAPKTCDKEAGPIWNQADANNKCPRTCAAPMKWNGQWKTTVPNKMSVCGCEGCP